MIVELNMAYETEIALPSAVASANGNRHWAKRTPRVAARFPVTMAAAMLVFVLVGGLLVRMMTYPAGVTSLFPLPALEIITRENIGELTELAQLGNGTIHSVAWSPDGESLAVAGALGVWLYEVDNLGASSLILNSERATHVAYSPDGALLASAHEDGALRLWNARTGALQTTLQEGGAVVNSVAFSPDGTLLASASGDLEDGTDHSVRVRDVATGEELRVLQRHTEAVTSVAFSPDGTLLASASWDNTARLWDVGTGEQIEAFQRVPGDGAPLVVFNADGSLLAFAEEQGVRWWDMASSAVRGDLARVGESDFPPLISSIAYSPRGNRLAVASTNEGVQFFSADPDIQGALRGLDELRSVDYVTFSPDGETLAAITSQSTLHLIDTTTLEARETLREHNSSIYNLAISQDGNTLVTGGSGGVIHVWDMTLGEERTAIDTEVTYLRTLALSPDGEVVAFAGFRGQQMVTRLRMIETGEERTLTGVDHTIVNGLAFSPDGSQLAASGWRENIVVWEITSDRQFELHNQPAHEYLSIAFSPDGNQIAAGAENGKLLVWNVGAEDSPTEIGEANAGERTFWVGYSPNEAMLFAGAQIFEGELGEGSLLGSIVHIYDAETGEERHRIEYLDPKETLYDVTFSADSTLFATMVDGDIIIRAADTGSELDVPAFERDTDTNRLLFSADGRLVITAGYDGLIRLWGVPE